MADISSDSTTQAVNLKNELQQLHKQIDELGCQYARERSIHDLRKWCLDKELPQRFENSLLGRSPEAVCAAKLQILDSQQRMVRLEELSELKGREAKRVEREVGKLLKGVEEERLRKDTKM